MKKLTAFLWLALACLIPGVASAANHLNNVGVLVDDTGSSVLALYGFTTGTPHTNNFGFLIDDTGALVVTGISSGGSGDALVANPLSQFAATTSAQLLGVISNETGSGLVVGNNGPTFIGPLLGTPASGVMTNVTGLTEAGQTLADNTTANASTSAHGYLLKLNNSATQFMNGQGAWATPAGGATAALDNLASVAVNSALLAGTDNSIALGSSSKRWSNLFSTAMTCGIAGTTSCVITGSGSTSGTATITWPATAGTVTNGIAFSNGILVPDGTSGSPSLSFSSNTGAGFYSVISGLIGIAGNARSTGAFPLELKATSGLIWGSDDSFSGFDMGLFRSAASVLQISKGTTSASTGGLKASYVQSGGTKFASNAGCTEGTTVGGASAGKFTVGQNTACTIVITMGDSDTATNGWACWANDQTAVPAVAIRQTASSTTTASLLMTVATSDVVNFGCMAY